MANDKNDSYNKSWWGNVINNVGWGSVYKSYIDETKEKSKKDKSIK